MITSTVLMIIENLLTFLKKNFFSKVKNACPCNEKLERTKTLLSLFNIENGEEFFDLKK